MRDLHIALAWVLVIGNGSAGVWALAAHWYEPLRHRALWVFTALVELVIFVQIGFGVALQSRDDIDLDEFHALYGFSTIIAVAIVYSYRLQLPERRFLLYGGGGLFVMGLGIRAMFLGT